MSLGVLIIVYIISDFYFLNQQKNTYFNLKKIIIHSLIFFGLSLFTLFYKYEHILLIIILILSCSHLLIHILTYFIKKIINNDPLLFFIEQLLHIIIIVLSIIFIDKYTQISIPSDNFYTKIILNLLLLGIPGNIIFKKIFIQFKPSEENSLPTLKNAGAIIGILERYLIFICIINELYTSIGLVFTAKSIARYKRISDDPAFSEYYLIGTLSSLLYTIVIYLLVFIL